MSDDSSKDLGGHLGTGWGFPPSFSKGGGEVGMVAGAEDVQQALRILFATRAGERPMQEGFGCAPDGFLFGELNAGLVGQIKAMIDDAVLAHEPRIRLQQVSVTEDAQAPGVLRIHVDYVIPEANARYNMVFPFYLNEATDLELS